LPTSLIAIDAILMSLTDLSDPFGTLLRNWRC
jgi:hypothetical protein